MPPVLAPASAASLRLAASSRGSRGVRSGAKPSPVRGRVAINNSASRASAPRPRFGPRPRSGVLSRAVSAPPPGGPETTEEDIDDAFKPSELGIKDIISLWVTQILQTYGDEESKDGAPVCEGSVDDLVGAQAWPNATDHDRGIATLWLNSRNLLAYRKRADVPKTPFYLYVANRLNGTAGMNVVHNALYARLYHELAVEAGINATSYYTDCAAMRPTDRSPTRLDTADGGTYNFKSTLDWRGAPGVGATEQASASEQLLWLCLAFGVRCDAGPAPPPPPPPVPLSEACKAEIRAVCAVAPAACGSCVHHHSGDLIAHGCPRKGVPGAAEACIARVAEWSRGDGGTTTPAPARVVKRGVVAPEVATAAPASSIGDASPCSSASSRAASRRRGRRRSSPRCRSSVTSRR